ncbi:MAG: Asp-tRNA(Asn)/Glu-tRNA(Gln) amidotransferase subunit GatA [Candidatus Aenigmarchaeota archaeon]|nr:Asp-tRNA(Asn)/Glu-tRNA(Gln) amidotransferase subunit GatA [Candidatus Aenigmarchaeota archaeon]
MLVPEFLDGVRSGSLDLEGFYSGLFRKMHGLDRKYSFFITLADREAKGQLEAVNRKARLPGLPVSVKDNICTRGIRTTAGSRILEAYMPPFDATSIARAKEQGGVVVGKTAQDEFGFGTFSTNCGFKVPKNPIDPSRSCGGSSGGAAGLVKALDEPHIAIAESTGGSISCPASFCGVAGLTPTYGRVSRYGLVDYANSLDKIGVIAKSTDDIALMLSVIAGYDQLDSTSINKPAEKYVLKPSKMKIGIPKEYFEGVDEKIAKLVWYGIKKLESEGHTYKEVSLPYTRHSLSAYYVIAAAEASTNLAKFCGMRYGAEERVEGSMNEYFSEVRTKYLGEEAKRRILLGTYSRMAGFRDQYYLKAMKVRTLIIEEFRKAFRNCDALIAPTMPVVAPKFTEIEKLTPLENYMMDVLTVAPNLAGIPMLSVPCGSAGGLPVGMHIMGDYLQEGKVLSLGNEMESYAHFKGR